MIPDLRLAFDEALVEEWDTRIASTALDAVDATCGSTPLLRSLVTKLVTRQHERDRGDAYSLAMAVLGALGGDPLEAAPAAALGLLWSAGMHAFNTGSTFSSMGSAELMLAGTTCVSLLPLTVIDHALVAAGVRLGWRREHASTMLELVDGRLADLLPDPETITGDWLMSTFITTAGAFCGAEAVMGAQLSAAVREEDFREWRLFGQILGVLFQLNTANAVGGTGRLMLAHALFEADIVDTDRLLALRQEAGTSLAARVELDAELRRVAVRNAHCAWLIELHSQADQLLSSLTEPSEYQRMLQLVLDMSALRLIRAKAAG